MFKIGENLLIEKGMDCYTLRYSYMTKACTKKGKHYESHMKEKLTYHATMRQACRYAIDTLAGECTCVDKLIFLLDNAEAILVEKCDKLS
jgi:hypothetical protein